MSLMSLTSLLLLTATPAWSNTLFALTPQSPDHPFPQATEAATWEPAAGRFGGPALRFAPLRGATVLLFDQPRPLITPDRYRVETWLKTDCPVFRGNVILFDAKDGHEYARYPINSLDPAPSPWKWRYGACDFFVPDSEPALHYNIEITVEVTAPTQEVELDGLRICGSDSILPNGDFHYVELVSAKSADPTAKIPRGWRRYYAADKAEAQADGSFEVKSGESGVPFLSVTKSVGEFALTAELMAAPAASTGLVARIRAEGTATALPTVVLQQYGQRGLLREDRSAAAASLGAATIISTPRIEKHSGAERLILLLLFPQDAGARRIQSAEVIAFDAENADPEVFVDQTGYDAGLPVRFIVSSTKFPAYGLGAFVWTSAGGPAYQGKLRALGRAVGQDDSDWGRYYFEGVIPAPAPKTYTLDVSLGGGNAAAQSVVVSPKRRLHETGELAYRFYSVQRCGCVVPGWHGLCHMDDAKLPDGSHADVTGGYHNAGDMHKHMGDNTPVSVYAMAAAYDRDKVFFDAIDEDHNGRADILDEAEWGSDWMLKMRDPKTGHVWMNVTNDIDYHGIPELDTNGIAGDGDDRVININDPSDLGAYNIAAWAVLARYLPGPKYREAAEKTWAVYEDRILAGYEPRQIIAALELFKITGAEKYRAAAERLVRNVLTLQNAEGWFASKPQGEPEYRIVDEGTIPACLASFALAQPASELSDKVKDALRNYFLRSLRLADNPFGIVRGYTGAEPFYFKSRDEWFGGSNSMYCSVAWTARLAAQVFKDDAEFSAKLRDHADNQMHWILGMNPLNLCMLEGKGTSSRIRYHHLYAEIPGHERGAVPGEIPNGVIREPGNADRPWFDFRPPGGSPPSAESCEPWLPHNAYYLLALTAK